MNIQLSLSSSCSNVNVRLPGRVDPVPFTLKSDLSGLGKYRQDFEVIETTVAQRRNLDSERMQHETDEQRQKREVRHLPFEFVVLSMYLNDIMYRHLLPRRLP